MKVNQRLKQIRNITLVGSVVNLLLTAGKIVAGIVGKSSAMVADGVHSLTDLITDIIVIVFVKISGKQKNEKYPYGYGKYETFATLLVSLALMAVAVGIFYAGAQKIFTILNGGIIEQPGMIALYAAIVSIISKEGMFWYTKIAGKKLNSPALIANGWHHRSDAFSSIGTALGISGAIFLGSGWRILDPLAGIIVSIFIVYVAWKIANPSIYELLEGSVDPNINEDVKKIIKRTRGVKYHHNLRTRKIGNTIGIDVHIKVSKGLSIEKSHTIATNVEKKIK